MPYPEMISTSRPPGIQVRQSSLNSTFHDVSGGSIDPLPSQNGRIGIDPDRDNIEMVLGKRTEGCGDLTGNHSGDPDIIDFPSPSVFRAVEPQSAGGNESPDAEICLESVGVPSGESYRCGFNDQDRCPMAHPLHLHSLMKTRFPSTRICWTEEAAWKTRLSFPPARS
jgi:hypothetical protein